MRNVFFLHCFSFLNNETSAVGGAMDKMAEGLFILARRFLKPPHRIFLSIVSIKVRNSTNSGNREILHTARHLEGICYGLHLRIFYSSLSFLNFPNSPNFLNFLNFPNFPNFSFPEFPEFPEFPTFKKRHSEIGWGSIARK